MNKFFGEEVLLHSETAIGLYREVRELPIIDYHSHLSEREIAEDKRFRTITELWLKGDHYKWRAMRACGIPEKYITGNAGDWEKFYAYASVLPKLLGNPLYYWTHFELRTLFGIEEPLNASTASGIYKRANERLEDLSVRKLLKLFRVEYLATTDDPISPLTFHGDYDGVRVRPTFRPDKALSLGSAYLKELGKAAGKEISTLGDWKEALEVRLCYFIQKGCTIADTSVEERLFADVPEREAEKLFLKGEGCDPVERARFISYGAQFLGGLFKKYHIVWQLHIGALRNVNRAAYASLGCDTGYDIMRGRIDTDAVAAFLNALASSGELPRTVLYSLNAGALPALCTLAPCFPEVHIGAAWWFNDTLKGIRSHLETVAEYSVLGTFPGMLTDSRSFSSYCRFDFFRRILCDYVGEKTEAGEYDGESARELLLDLCYRNAKSLTDVRSVKE